MDKEFKNGLMVLLMKVVGRTIKQTEKASLLIVMETFVNNQKFLFTR